MVVDCTALLADMYREMKWKSQVWENILLNLTSFLTYYLGISKIKTNLCESQDFYFIFYRTKQILLYNSGNIAQQTNMAGELQNDMSYYVMSS